MGLSGTLSSFTYITPSANPQSAVLRNGFQYTLLTRGADIRRTTPSAIQIQDQLDNRANTCTFTVDGQSNMPVFGEKIEIRDSEDGDRLLFAGVVQAVEQVYEGLTDQLAWNVTAVDFTWLLNRRRPFGTYVQQSASDVVKDLIARYAPGFTVNHVQTNLAKVTVSLDGSQDLVTVLNQIAAAIGGGHWYVDATQDVHFFHVVPSDLVLPPSLMPTVLGTAMTVAEGAAIPSTVSYGLGYYLFQHTFVYSDGSESSLQACSNLILAQGTNQLSFSNIPLGTSAGALTCVARRIYMRRLCPVSTLASDPTAGPNHDGIIFTGPTSLETITPFCEINDNSTTAFTTWFQTTGASSPAVIAIPNGIKLPLNKFTGHPVGPTTAPSAFASFALVGSPAWVDSNGANEWISDINWVQFKVAFLYRDGTVSFVGPASSSVGSRQMINGQVIQGYSLQNVPVGPTLGTNNDVIGRLVYLDFGVPPPGSSFSGPWFTQPIAVGVNWEPSLFLPDPDWSHPSGTVIVLLDNVTTTVALFQLGPLGVPWHIGLPSDLAALYASSVFVGGDVKPFNNQNALSSDPVPVWPNPDGPSLEDDDAPADLDDNNTDLLHQDAGQGFTYSLDISQVRNRVYVYGSGSAALATANVGDGQIQVNDIAAFSPAGGQINVYDPASQTSLILNYTGIAGVVGRAFITLSTTLTQVIAQGAIIRNFFQADDLVSQSLMGQAELDVNGNPTDGVHEYTINDPSLKAVFQLYMRAFAELELFGRPIGTIKYSTRDPNSRSGRTVHVDLTNPPCQGDFLIQSVTIDQIRDEGDQLAPRYNVSASSVRYDLNDLLLEIVGAANIANSTPVSAVGATGAATLAAGGGSSTGSLPARKYHFTELTPLNFGAATTPGLSSLNCLTGTAASGAGSSQVGIADDQGYWFRSNCGSDSGQEARVVFPNGGAICYPQHNPSFKLRLRTSPVITFQRMQISICDAANHPNGLNNAGTNTAGMIGCGLRYFTPDGDVGWTPFTCDGSAAFTKGVTPFPYAASFIYDITIMLTAQTVVFTMNGLSHTLALPPVVKTVGLGLVLRLFPDTAQPGGIVVTNKYFDWNAIYCDHD